MRITLNASVVVGEKLEHATFTVDLDEGGKARIKELLARADADRLMGPKFFKALVARRRKCALTVLHNGQRLELPRGLKQALADGDDVTLLTPVVGG